MSHEIPFVYVPSLIYDVWSEPSEAETNHAWVHIAAVRRGLGGVGRDISGAKSDNADLLTNHLRAWCSHDDPYHYTRSLNDGSYHGGITCDAPDIVLVDKRIFVPMYSRTENVWFSPHEWPFVSSFIQVLRSNQDPFPKETDHITANAKIPQNASSEAQNELYRFLTNWAYGSSARFRIFFYYYYDTVEFRFAVWDRRFLRYSATVSIESEEGLAQLVMVTYRMSKMNNEMLQLHWIFNSFHHTLHIHKDTPLPCYPFKFNPFCTPIELLPSTQAYATPELWIIFKEASMIAYGLPTPKSRTGYFRINDPEHAIKFIKVGDKQGFIPRSYPPEKPYPSEIIRTWMNMSAVPATPTDEELLYNSKQTTEELLAYWLFAEDQNTSTCTPKKGIWRPNFVKFNGEFSRKYEHWTIKYPDEFIDVILKETRTGNRWRKLWSHSIYYCFAFEEEYLPMSEFRNAFELLELMFQAVKSYQYYATNAETRLMHRDLSPGNLMFTRDKKSENLKLFIIDWDNSIRVDDYSGHRYSQRGTHLFMSFAVRFQHVRRPHRRMDDCESLYYVFLVLLARCAKAVPSCLKYVVDEFNKLRYTNRRKFFLPNLNEALETNDEKGSSVIRPLYVFLNELRDILLERALYATYLEIGGRISTEQVLQTPLFLNWEMQNDERIMNAFVEAFERFCKKVDEDKELEKALKKVLNNGFDPLCLYARK